MLTMPIASLAVVAAMLFAGSPSPQAPRADDALHALVPGGDEQFVVVAFLGVECPLAKLAVGRLGVLAREFAPRGVRFVGVDPNEHDSPDEIRRFAHDHGLAFSLVRDDEFRAVDYCGATRTPEVAVVDRAGRIRYRGRIDDQHGLGTRRDAPSSHDLRNALAALLDGREPPAATTPAVGCAITRRRPTAAEPRITYAEHVAPLITAKCAGCHRPGEVGPLSLLTYDDVRGHSAMIDEVVAADRMPPWPAARGVGRFKNAPSLNDQEKALLRDWIAADCPPGDPTKFPATLLETTDGDDWRIGRPDAVVALPREFTVPAGGVVEYQYFEVDPQFGGERWIAAVEVRPTNRAVVHHCNIFLKLPGSSVAAEQGSLGSVCLAAMAAGNEATTFPPGMAKRLPAGWRLLFVVHYTPIGTPQVDRLQLGLKFADPTAVEREVATRLIVDEQLHIPPHAAAHRVEHAAKIERELLLLAMFPHLHLRGKSFRYELEHSDGSRELLLDVPRWDFAWQPRYELAEPKRLPAGSVLHCTAVYDNSAANPANPDPTKTVLTGPLSTDEMFNGYYDVAPAEINRPTSSPPPSPLQRLTPIAALAALLIWVRRGTRTSSKS